MCPTARRVSRSIGCARRKGRVTYQRFTEMKVAPSGAIFGKTRCCGARVVIAPDEHVSKVILPGGLQLSQGGLTPGQGLAPGDIHGLDLLHGHGTACDVHRAAKTVLIILAVPDQLGLHLRERMGIVRPPANGLSQGRRPPGEEQ